MYNILQMSVDSHQNPKTNATGDRKGKTHTRGGGTLLYGLLLNHGCRISSFGLDSTNGAFQNTWQLYTVCLMYKHYIVNCVLKMCTLLNKLFDLILTNIGPWYKKTYLSRLLYIYLYLDFSAFQGKEDARFSNFFWD